MHIIVDPELINGEYHVRFTVGESPESDKVDFEKQVAKFGKIFANFGGEFKETVAKTVIDTDTNEETTTTEEVVAFKFNENIREINDELKYSRVFKETQYGENAKKYAKIYAQTMDKRIREALDELKNKYDDFSSPDIDIHY